MKAPMIASHKKQHGESAAAARQAVEVITLMNHVARGLPAPARRRRLRLARRYR
jgi:hypothetical protein